MKLPRLLVLFLLLIGTVQATGPAQVQPISRDDLEIVVRELNARAAQWQNYADWFTGDARTYFRQRRDGELRAIGIIISSLDIPQKDAHDVVSRLRAEAESLAAAAQLLQAQLDQAP